MNYLDLFSGIGGFALGAYWAGWRFERHYFSEIDLWCCKLYQQRFPDAIPLGDIREIDGKALVQNAARMECEAGSEVQGKIRTVSENEREHDHTDRSGTAWILAGGFPCQDISVAGKGAGIEGLRSGLWFEYARLIGEIRPRYAIMENVGALTRRGLDRVLGSLAEIGYDAQWSDIRASDLGAPHRRERIWIVAFPEEFGCDWNGEQSETEGSAERREVSNPSGQGLEGQRKLTGRVGTQQYDARHDSWWSVEPDVGRVAHGVPSRVDRLRGLGNAIVPQIAEMIFRGLCLDIDRNTP